MITRTALWHIGPPQMRESGRLYFRLDDGSTNYLYLSVKGSRRRIAWWMRRILSFHGVVAVEHLP